MPFDPNQPFNDLPLLPPAADLETRPVLKACIEARVALAELKIAGDLIPNQAVLINCIPILEAKASSAIENIVTTTDRLFRFAAEPLANADPATQEALRYRLALYQGFRDLAGHPLNARTAAAICSRILGVDTAVRSSPGTALVSQASASVVYTPPQGSDLLLRLLANWEVYLHATDDTDPLVRLAVQHYQFEAIHPFADGNGRTGRVLNLLYLVERGLLSSPVLYLSRHINRNRGAYYRHLGGVTRQGDWESWILFIVDAVRETARWTVAKIQAIRDLQDETSRVIRQCAPKVSSRELIDLIFVQPYCRIGDVVASSIARRQSASVYLRQLAAIGVLEERKVGREKLFVNPAFLSLLSDSES